MSENNQSTSTLLVTGASGQLGRRVVELLLEAGETNIIATTRTPEKLADFSQRGVTVRPADFDDAVSLAAAFAGADRMLLISTAVFGEQRVKQHLAAVKAAEDVGVKHVVYTSLMNPGPDSPVILAPDHHATEQALLNSGLGWTVLRENLYTETLIQSLAQAIQMGQLFSAAGDGTAAYITREDCARAAAAVLASSFDGRRTLDITGPEALSQADLAALVSTLSGKPVTYIPVEAEVMVDNMAAAGLPRFIAELLVSFNTAIAQGKLSAVSNAVEELTGKKPMSVTEFVTAQREALLQATPA